MWLDAPLNQRDNTKQNRQNLQRILPKISTFHKNIVHKIILRFNTIFIIWLSCSLQPQRTLPLRGIHRVDFKVFYSAGCCLVTNSTPLFPNEELHLKANEIKFISEIQ